MDFSMRSTVAEYLDDPELEKETFRKAYADINQCNSLLGGTSIIINAIKDLIRANTKESYTIYDMGCGDGHMLREVSKASIKWGVPMNLVGFDLRDDVLELAREASVNYGNISFRKADMLRLNENQKCDILLCTLTMHHFEQEQIETFVKKFIELAKIGVVINDLQRSKLAYFLFRVFSVFFIKSAIAKKDGLISISKGFRKLEIKKMANTLKNAKHTIAWKWAFRYLWVMKPLQAR